MVMITAYGTINQAVDVMKAGAFDFITKPFSAEDLEGIVDRAVRRKAKPPVMKAAVRDTSSSTAIVTNDASFKRIIEIAVAVAKSNASVLIQGDPERAKS